MLTLQSRVLPEVSSLHQSIRDRVLTSVALLREAASDDINELSELFLARVRPRKESQESVEWFFRSYRDGEGLLTRRRPSISSRSFPTERPELAGHSDPEANQPISRSLMCRDESELRSRWMRYHREV